VYTVRLFKKYKAGKCQTQTASRAANETKTVERAAKFEKNPNRATF